MIRTFSGLVLSAFLALMAAKPVSAGELSFTGEWQSLSAENIKGTWSAQVTQNATSIEGTMTLTGSNVFKSGTVKGTLETTNIAFGVLTEAGMQASFNGKVDGAGLSGEWESSAVGDHGVWYGSMTKGAIP